MSFWKKLIGKTNPTPSSRVVLDLDADWSQVREHVLPQLWHYGEVALAGDRGVRKRVGPYGYGCVYLSMVTDDGAEAWVTASPEYLGCSFAELSAAALANLRRQPQLSFEQASHGLWLSRNGDGFDAARALFGPAWLRQTLSVVDPVVIAPDRSSLIVAERRDLASVAAALEQAFAVYMDEDRPSRKLSCSPMIADGDAWSVVLPRQISPELAQFERMLCALEFSDWYAAFEEHREGKDAPQLEHENLRYGFSGRVPSAPWIEGRDYLFHAEEVRLIKKVTLPDDAEAYCPASTVAFDELPKLTGQAHLKSEDVWPPVYEVGVFPLRDG